MSRLRKQLAGAGAGGQVICTDPAGYRLQVDARDVDLREFHRLRDQARRAAASNGPSTDARQWYRAALQLWRGAALAGIDSEPVRRAAAALDEERLQVLEERIQTELALGGAGELVGELSGLVRQHPFREALQAALMLALYRAGRQAEALATYRRVRQLLHDELATEPGGDLRRLHQAILNRDPRLEERPPRAPVSAPDPVPRELPADVAGFTGRAEALAALDGLLPGDPYQPPGPGVVAAVTGTAGVGKTALAVHWGHRVRDRFPDGQLFVNLRGYDPVAPPVAATEALRGFLDALQVSPAAIPASEEALVGLYRSVLADRRVLVVLDNARDAEQVRPLLPGAPGCLTVVTSRNQLFSLVAVDGARPLTVDLLTPEEASRLLERRLGADRMAAEPEAINEIVARCARLPLALVVVSARAAIHAGFPPHVLARELREAGSALDAVSDPDAATTDLRGVLSWSYHALSAEAARLFRLLGLHPGPEVTAPAAAALAGVPVPQVRRPLAELTHAHLLCEPVPGRYACHDLLRAYATELAQADGAETNGAQTNGAQTNDAQADRRRAQHRMLDYYLHTAHAAALLLDPHRAPMVLTGPAPGVVIDDLRGAAQATGWLTAERAVLLAMIRHAESIGFDAHSWQLSWTLLNFVDRQGRWRDFADVLSVALAAARRLADPRGLAHTHRALGWSLSRLGAQDEATSHLWEALALYDRLGDHLGEGHTLLSLCMIDHRRRRFEDALQHAEQALDRFRAAGHRVGQARALSTVGGMHARLGDYQQAVTHCRQALALERELGDRQGIAEAWSRLGYAQHHLGAHREAVTSCRHAAETFRELDDRYNQAGNLALLGDAHHAGGEREAAERSWRQALTILEQLDHPEAAELRAKLARTASSGAAPPR